MGRITLRAEGRADGIPPPDRRIEPPSATAAQPEPWANAGRLVGPLLLIALGVLLLVGNFVPLGGSTLLLGLGLTFLIARVGTGRYGFSIPAGLLLGFGTFVMLEQARVLTEDSGGWFFVLLGLGFVGAYFVGWRPAAFWPLVPGAILVGFGLLLLGQIAIAPLADLVWLAALWPIGLIVVGCWLLGRPGLPVVWRRPVAALGLILLVGYALIVVAAGLAAAARHTERPAGAYPIAGTPFQASAVLPVPDSGGEVG